MKTLRDLHDIEGKRILLRTDWNVPVEKGKVVDDNRIVASLETIRYLLDHRARLIVCSHLGRPEGKPSPEFSLKPVVTRLKELFLARKIKSPVRMSPEVVGKETTAMVEATKPGEMLVLDNLRFNRGEELNDAQFSAELATLCDLFVDDAFGAIHRAHASITGVAEHLPSYAGRLVEEEVRELENLREKPGHPFVVILGGAKPDDKIALMQNLKEKVDTWLVGGGIANTFLKVKDIDVKDSLSGDDKSLSIAKELLPVLGKRLILPTDFIWDGDLIADIGLGTITTFEKHIENAKTIFWNGNLGKSEDSRFVKGTRAVAVAIAGSRAKSVVGGGDTVSAIDQFGVRNHISFVSTGGGATLEFLAGKSLPGLEVLGYRAEG